MNNKISRRLIKSRVIKTLVLLTAYPLVLSTLSGCGYTTRSMISSQYKTIYISQFLNKIDITSEAKASRKYQLYRPILETDITRAVFERFMLDGNLRIAKEKDADLILKGSLVDYRRDVLRYATDDNPEEYRISLAVDISLWDSKEQKTLWEERNFIGDTTYFISGSNAKTESTAIQDAVKDLARRVIERVVENW